uniref:Uncharacterized protein n=1 Tax=Anguilla anguilla TaxID=7936 RepID=A0A0E9TD84_ANGAN
MWRFSLSEGGQDLWQSLPYLPRSQYRHSP